MHDEPLHLATREELRDALGYALRFGARGKPHRHAIEDMALIAAGVLVDHLELSGFVVMKKRPSAAHSAPGTAAARARG